LPCCVAGRWCKLTRKLRPQPAQRGGRILFPLTACRTFIALASELTEAIKHYEKLYNHCIPQKALGYKTPIQALKEWQNKNPALFKKKVHDLSGLDSLVE
jgi:hypothetical protein